MLATSKKFTLVFVSVPLQHSLHDAAKKGNVNAVQTLIERGVDVNTKDDNKVSIKEILWKLGSNSLIVSFSSSAHMDFL